MSLPVCGSFLSLGARLTCFRKNISCSAKQTAVSPWGVCTFLHEQSINLVGLGYSKWLKVVVNGKRGKGEYIVFGTQTANKKVGMDEMTKLCSLVFLQNDPKTKKCKIERGGQWSQSNCVGALVNPKAVLDWDDLPKWQELEICITSDWEHKIFCARSTFSWAAPRMDQVGCYFLQLTAEKGLPNEGKVQKVRNISLPTGRN